MKKTIKKIQTKWKDETKQEKQKKKGKKIITQHQFKYWLMKLLNYESWKKSHKNIHSKSQISMIPDSRPLVWRRSWLLFPTRLRWRPTSTRKHLEASRLQASSSLSPSTRSRNTSTPPSCRDRRRGMSRQRRAGRDVRRHQQIRRRPKTTAESPLPPNAVVYFLFWLCFSLS